MTLPPMLEGFPFTHTPLLIGGKAMEHYGLRRGADYDLVVAEEDFRRLHLRFPAGSFVTACDDAGIRIGAYELYASQFGFIIQQLERGALEHSWYQVAHVEFLLFLKTLTLVGDPANKKARHDLLLLMRWLGIELFLPGQAEGPFPPDITAHHDS